jgi:hypothetical protein
MKREVLNRFFLSMIVCTAAAAILMLGTLAIAEDSDGNASDPKPAKQEYTAVDGTCNFMGMGGTWSAKLTANEDGTYKASYVAAFRGNNKMTYEGSMKSDWKGEVSGEGKSTGGGGNGSFEFSGKFDENGVAKCDYKEIGGRGGMGRTGTLTVNLPKPEGDAAKTD